MKPKGSVKYYPENDVLYVFIQAGEEAKSVKIAPGVLAELNKSGRIIGLEILDASSLTMGGSWKRSPQKMTCTPPNGVRMLSR